MPNKENFAINIETQIQKSKKLEKKVGNLQCNICNQHFKTITDKMSHMRTHSANKKVYNCAHCERQFLYKDTLREHVFIHDLFKNEFACSYCQESFHLKSVLNDHVIKEHTDQYTATERYRCLLSGNIFILESKFHEHYKSHEPPEGEKNYSCPMCRRPHLNFSEMKEHLLSHSNIQGFKCKVPGCKSWIQSIKCLKPHMETHGPRQYLCDVCGKLFAQPCRLREHSRTHRNEKSFKCETCGKFFAQKSGLNAHRTLHTNKKPHKCNSCGKTFRLRAHMMRHKLIHNTEKNFECMVCGKKFVQERYLKQHSVLHSSKRQFWCANCDTSYNFKCSLKTHLITCGNEASDKDNFFCTVCNHYYADLNVYLEHMCSHKKGWNCPKCNKNLEDFSLLSQHVMTCDEQKDVQVEAPQKKSEATINRGENIEFMTTDENNIFEELEEKTKEPKNTPLAESKNELDQEMSKCLECEKCFEHEDDLIEHISIHARQGSQFFCKTCDQRFRRKASFINHWNRNHSKTLENDKLADVYRQMNKVNQEKKGVKRTIKRRLPIFS